jgi:hypothetical protein
MSDGQLLLIALAAFTLYECLRWVPARAWVFQASGGKEWRASHPWNVFRTRGGGMVLLMPVPPLEPHVLAAAWPCVPHEEGLCIWSDESGAARHIPWAQVSAHAEGAELHFTPEHRVLCSCATGAEAWAAHVNGWVRQSQPQRTESFLKLAAAMLAVKPLKRTAQVLEMRTRRLRRIGGWTFFCSVLILPVIYWRFADGWPTYAAAALLLTLTLSQAAMLYRQVRRDPRLRKGAWQHLFGAALFPPASMRAADWVCATCTPEAHPLAALKAWSSAEDLHRGAARFWREARWPLGDVPTLPWSGPEVDALARFFKAHGIEPETLDAPPALPEGSTHWCPRCHTPYQEPAAECADCGGMKLLPSCEPGPAK